MVHAIAANLQFLGERRRWRAVRLCQGVPSLDASSDLRDSWIPMLGLALSMWRVEG